MKNWIGVITAAIALFILYCVLNGSRASRESYANWGYRFGPHLPVYSEYSLLLPYPSYEVSERPDFALQDEFQKTDVQRHLNSPNVLSYTANQNYKNGLCLKGAGADSAYRPCIKPYQLFWVKNRAGDPMYYNSLLRLPTVQKSGMSVGIHYDVNHPALI